MSNNKKYYWLKLKEDFFRDKRIKKLRRIAGGDTYTVIYLKLQLLSLKNNGALIFEGIEPTFEEEMALDIDEDLDNVKITIAFLKANGLLDETDQDHYVMTETIQCIGSESASAARVRKHRELKAQLENNKAEKPKLEEPKSNAQRQKMFRAKKVCEEQQHVPLIEDYINNKRYGGNYYLVLKRDAFKCAICGSIENLCVHHIDGYDENKPQNNYENKLITLCRCCHANVHAGAAIPANLLESIDYNVTLLGNDNVTNCNIEIEKREKRQDKEIEQELEIELEQEKETTELTALPANAGEVLTFEEQAFNSFWSIYPKKVNKKGAFTSFKRIKHLKEELPLILAAVERFKASKDWQKEKGQYIPHPQTFINQERWKDQHEETREQQLNNINMDGWV